MSLEIQLNNPNEFIRQSENLVRDFNDFILSNNLQIIAAVDHVGYRCASHEIFLKHLEMFSQNSQYIFQSIISNRPIAIIKLKNPIKTVAGEIWFLELADQKPDNSQKEGFDHLEIVPIGGDFDEMKNTVENIGAEMKKVVRPHHTTYDIALGKYSVKLSVEPLIVKIKRDEFN